VASAVAGASSLDSGITKMHRAEMHCAFLSTSSAGGSVGSILLLFLHNLSPSSSASDVEWIGRVQHSTAAFITATLQSS